MKFGSVDNPDDIDFTLPGDHPDTAKILDNSGGSSKPEIYVGCAKWNRQDLKGFYPRGTKDELIYYATQFNSVEMNATYHRMFPPEQFAGWKKKVSEDFRFFPKVNGQISHRKWLSGVESITEDYLESVSTLEDNLGTVFLQLPPRFMPKFMDRVANFLEFWPEDIPLAAEFRHRDWFHNPEVATELYHLLEEHNVSNVIVDTGKFRDLLHMRLTNGEAFIRYVGTNHPSDYSRLDDWVERLSLWTKQGIAKIDFFVHQNIEVESPKLAAYFIRKLNKEIGTDLKIPDGTGNGQEELF